MPVKINGATNGSVTLAAPATGSDVTLTLPAASGTVQTVPGAWTSYTPILTEWTLGNGTLTGSYSIIGKTVSARVNFVVGSTTTKSGNLTLSLPVTSVNYTNAAHIGVCYMEDAAVVGFNGFVRLGSTTTMNPFRITSTTGQADFVTPTGPFTWDTGDFLGLTITYEAA